MVANWEVPIDCLATIENMDNEIQELEKVKNVVLSSYDFKKASEHIVVTRLEKTKLTIRILKGIVSKKIEDMQGSKKRDRDFVLKIESLEKRERELILTVEGLKKRDRELILTSEGLESEGQALRLEIGEKNREIEVLQREAEDHAQQLAEKAKDNDNLQIKVEELTNRVRELELLMERNRARDEENKLQLQEAIQRLECNKLDFEAQTRAMIMQTILPAAHTLRAALGDTFEIFSISEEKSRVTSEIAFAAAGRHDFGSRRSK